MKVLLTHELFPPDFAGGGEYIVLKTALGLRKRGVDVRVLTTGNPDVSEYQRIPTMRLPVSRYAFNFQLRPILQAARWADVIQTSCYHACLPSASAGRILGKPVVCLVLALFQSAWKEMRSPLLGGLSAWWERRLISLNYSHFVFLSDFSRDLGVSLGVPKDRTVVNSPGIDHEAYRPASVKDHVVFFTSKLDVRKGIYDLLAVARELPHVSFRVMGWGPDEAKVRALAPCNVEFLPFERGAPGASLRDAFSRASIFFFPSKAEGFGLVILEAMAAGCAVVSSVPLGFEGVLVPVGDRGAMVEAIDRLWNDREATSRIGRRNVDLSRQYTWDRFTDVLLHTYEQVLSNPRWRTRHSPPLCSGSANM